MTGVSLELLAQLRDTGTFAATLWLAFELRALLRQRLPERLERIERRLGMDEEDPPTNPGRILRAHR